MRHLLEAEGLTRRFVELQNFISTWKSLKFTDVELLELELLLLEDSKRAPVIQGTGGLRKFRFSPSTKNSGKSGAYRIIYLDIEQEHLVILLVVYSKNVSDTLTKHETNELKQLVDQLKTHYGGNQNG
ncbi:hypothetical protein [Saccharibacillus sacchari]|uniref:Uncharacterized protein n=1 Tax=Saccharibacillus sacchari TaxID=456493 RepID=A0ACC6P7H8_9BACL